MLSSLFKCLKYLGLEGNANYLKKIRSCSCSKCFSRFLKLKLIEIIEILQDHVLFLSATRGNPHTGLRRTHWPAAHTPACSASIHLDIVFMMCAKHEAVLRQVCQDVCGSIWPWLKDAIPLVSMCAGTCVHVEAGGQARISVLRCHLPRLEKQSLSLA